MQHGTIWRGSFKGAERAGLATLPVLMLGLLLFVTTLFVIDLGRYFVLRLRLQSVTDASAQAGADVVDKLVTDQLRLNSKTAGKAVKVVREVSKAGGAVGQVIEFAVEEAVFNAITLDPRPRQTAKDYARKQLASYNMSVLSEPSVRYPEVPLVCRLSVQPDARIKVALNKPFEFKFTNSILPFFMGIQPTTVEAVSVGRVRVCP